MQSTSCNVTGEHQIAIVGTRSEATERQRLLAAIPSDVQRKIIPNITNFSGSLHENANEWLKNAELFCEAQSTDIISVFNLLLTGTVKDFWLDFRKLKKPTDIEAKDWFRAKYGTRKSYIQMIDDISSISQKEDERHDSFVRRVTKAVKSILNSGRTEEEIITEIVKSRIHPNGLRENFAMKRDISLQEMQDLATTYETNCAEKQGAVLQLSYAQATKKKNLPGKPAVVKKDFGNSSRNFTRPQPYTRPYPSRQTHDHEGNHRGSEDTRKRPSASLKFIAKKMYNAAKGLPPPKEEKLRPGDCFCCGSHGHFRKEFPLKNCCLICGKTGHSFRKCYKIQSPKRRVHNVRCITEEDNSTDIMYEDEHQEHHEMNTLNARGSTVEISSVEYSQ